MATTPADWNFPGGTDCSVCRQRVEVRAFPAIQFETRGERPEAVVGGDEAACYYHPHNRAVTPCDRCGRFLCALCDLPLDGQHLCSQCVNLGLRNQQLAAADTQRTYYDSIALAFATWPMLIFYFTIFTAPIALYYVIRYWKQPQGMLPRSRARFIIAGLLAVLQLIGWVVLVGVFGAVYFRAGGKLE
jgi:hypothetical protein